MVAHKDQPALELVRSGASPGEIAGHCTLVDHQAQFQQFAVNPRCSPTILPRHPSDELSELLWDPGTADPFGSGYQPPEQPEALALPADHRIGLDDDEGVGPVVPGVAKEHPEYPIRRSQSGSGVPLLEDGRLLAQGEVLDHEIQPGPEQDPSKGNRQCPNEANHAASIAGGPLTGKAHAFLHGPEGSRNQSLPSIVERQRFVRTIKESCLDRMILIGEASLHRATSEFVTHYHRERNHQGLQNRIIEPELAEFPTAGTIDCRKRLGGILRYYYREAA